MNTSRISLVAVLLTVFVMGAPFSSAGVIRDDRLDTSYTGLAATPEYACVGQIELTTGSGNYLASGTLIAPDWVLTAGHVVDDATSLTFSISGSAYTAKKWVAHKKWKGDLLGGYDIGLVQLSDEVSGGIAPATLYTGSAELGAEGVSVGFGMTGTGQTGAVIFDGRKRAGENVIDAFYSRNPRKTPRIFLSDFDNPGNPGDNAYGSAFPLELEYLIAPGDSGGGVFVNFADDGLDSLLVGVHSFGASFDGLTDSDYGDISGHTRVSAFDEWINDTISGGGGGNGKKGNPPGHDRTLYGQDDAFANVPEPGSAVMLVLGTLALIRHRRRR